MTRTSAVLAAVGLTATLLAPALAWAEPTSETEVRGGIRVLREGPEGESEAVEMPLVGLGVSAHVSGSLATVEVEQVYENPFDARIEAVYVFPLPEDAAIAGMSMVIGERRIRADLQEREEARRTYEAARERGQTTALLEQERPNVFTQSVANIEPGYPIHVLVTYVEQLPYEDGRYRFAFPMVVGPRYIPGEPIAHNGTGVLADTDVVSDASRITPPMLPEGVLAPYEVDFHLELEAGLPISEITSSSHAVELDWLSDGALRISLPPEERQPNRDIVVEYSLEGSDPALGVLTHHDERGGFFTLLIEPPAAPSVSDVRPKELVFVVDTSGSMYGEPLDACRALMRHALDNLNPDDTFRILNFSDSVTALSETPLSSTPANLSAAAAYIETLESMGGTNMESGIRAALEPAPAGDRMRIVLFLTDGYIGNESQILDLIDSVLGQSRLFALGVGSSVNRFLLDEMAEVGRGTVHYVNVDEDPTLVVEQFYSRIRNPILTDVTIDWGGLDVAEVYPTRIPDLFEGAPLLITGRYGSFGEGRIEVSGRRGVRPVSFGVDVEFPNEEGARPELAYVWARRAVDGIESDAFFEADEVVREQVLAIALPFGLLTRFTSFVAVEERIAVDATDPLRTVAVAVPLPEGASDERIGLQVTPEYVQPGDPELTVDAPAGTVAVTAYFPFDLVQTLAMDPSRGLWTSRFLVPRDFEEGEHEILIAIERNDGTVEYAAVPLWVDATAPLIEASMNPGSYVSVDDVVTFVVHVLTPSWSACAPRTDDAGDGTVGLPLDPLCAEILPERIKFIRLYLPDGRAVRMLPSAEDDSLWTFDFRIRASLAAGRYDVQVEAVDVAGNTTTARLVLEVGGPVASASIGGER